MPPALTKSVSRRGNSVICMGKIIVMTMALFMAVVIWLQSKKQGTFLVDRNVDLIFNRQTDYPVPAHYVHLCIGIPSLFESRRHTHRHNFFRFRPQLKYPVTLKFFVSNDSTDLYNDHVFDDVQVVNVQRLDTDSIMHDRLKSSTTSKVFAMFQWAIVENCTHLLQQDEDSYANYLAIEYLLTTRPSKRWIMGRFRYHATVEPWFGTFFRTDVFPPYPLGMGYLLTSDICETIVGGPIPALVTQPEDAMVGIWIAWLNIDRIDSDLFHNRLGHGGAEPWAEGPCTENSLLIHYVNGMDWEKINDQGVLQC